jgi:PH/SEC7 domain-containing protein
VDVASESVCCSRRLLRRARRVPVGLFSLSPSLAFYRQKPAGAGGRPGPSPPSSFPAGLQPVSPSDGHRLRRASRTDLDFEQALQGSGTFVFQESPDLSMLGNDAPVSPAPTLQQPRRAVTSPAASAPRIGVTPSTPVIVPPSPTPGPSHLSDLFGTAVASDLETKRRSMYRAAGTASSPDLATLVRKAKEKGQPIPRRAQKDEHPLPALPTSSSDAGGATVRASERPGRARSSTSSAVNTTPSKGKGKLEPNRAVTSPPDWVTGSPRAADGHNYGVRAPAGAVQPLITDRVSDQTATSSVRQKTSAFLSKMFGQNTVRERSVRPVSLSIAAR